MSQELDQVTRELRSIVDSYRGGHTGRVCEYALTAIDSLRSELATAKAEIERLKDALTELVTCNDIVKRREPYDGKKVRSGRWSAAWSAARSALET